jgi:type I restriction enzyme S subunit
MVKLGDVVEVIMGQAPPGAECNFDGNGCIFVKAGEFGPSIPIVREWTTKPLKFAKRGDTLVCVVGATCGKVNRAIDCAIGRSVAAIRAKHGQLDEDYLFNFVSSWSMRLRQMSQGAAQTVISKDMIHDLYIPLPPLTEQKRIAAILDKADAIRRKRQQAIQLADDFLRAVFLEMFGDPVTNPKGWEMKPMQKLIKIQGGYAFKSEDFSESGIPVVKIGNANKVGFTTKGISFIQPDNPNKIRQYELYAGDLLMSLTGTVGKDDYANVTEVTDEYDMYYLNQRVAKISVINGQITKNFIKHYLAHPKIKSEITKNNRGVRQANIGNADIYELSVPVPSNSMLEKFDMLVEQASSLITKIDSAPSQNDSFFNALSQKAFSDQL